MSSLPVEVRQCPRCQQGAVVLVTEWAHTNSHESTKDYRCQGCGAWFVKQPASRVIAYWILGVMLSLSCLMGLPFLYLAWRQRTFDQRLPLVSAPVPRMRFPGGPPKRTCGKCGGIAKAMRITRHTHKGVPTGTDSEYVCGQCGLEFSTENVLGHLFSAFGGVAMGGVAAAFLVAGSSPAWRWGGGIGMGLLTVFVFGQSAVRIWNRLQHKVIEEHVL